MSLGLLDGTQDLGPGTQETQHRTQYCGRLKLDTLFSMFMELVCSPIV